MRISLLSAQKQMGSDHLLRCVAELEFFVDSKKVSRYSFPPNFFEEAHFHLQFVLQANTLEASSSPPYELEAVYITWFPEAGDSKIYKLLFAQEKVSARYENPPFSFDTMSPELRAFACDIFQCVAEHSHASFELKATFQSQSIHFPSLGRGLEHELMNYFLSLAAPAVPPPSIESGSRLFSQVSASTAASRPTRRTEEVNPPPEQSVSELRAF